MIRRLGPADLRQIERHFLMLSTHDRLYRFNAPLGEAAIGARLAAIDWSKTIVLGAYDGRKLRGIAELAELRGDGLKAREVAISVDYAHRRRGIGRRLLGQAASRARSLGCRRLVFSWHPENGGFARFLAACGGTVLTHPPAGWLEIPDAGVRTTHVAHLAGAMARRSASSATPGRRAENALSR